MEALLDCSLQTLEKLRHESKWFTSFLDSSPFLERCCEIHGFPIQGTFLQLLEVAGISEYDKQVSPLMEHYALTGNLEFFKKMVQEGGDSWKESGSAAEYKSNYEILDYIFDLLGKENVSEILAAYRCRKLDRLLGADSDDEIQKEFFVPTSILILEGMLIGAILKQDESRISKILQRGVNNYKEALLSASVLGSMKIYKLFERYEDDYESSILIAAKQGHEQLFHYLYPKASNKLEALQVLEDSGNDVLFQ